MSGKAKGGTEAARLAQVNVRLTDLTRRQIAEIRAATGITSDANVIALAVDRMYQQELPQKDE